MAHGPVNKTFNLNIDDRVIYRIKQADYDAIKEMNGTLVKVFVYGTKTNYTVIIPSDKDAMINKLESDGFKLSNGRTYVKYSVMEVEFDE